MSSELSPVLREKIESTLRFLTMDAVQKAGIGHVGAPLALVLPDGLQLAFASRA